MIFKILSLFVFFLGLFLREFPNLKISLNSWETKYITIHLINNVCNYCDVCRLQELFK